MADEDPYDNNLENRSKFKTKKSTESNSRALAFNPSESQLNWKESELEQN